MTYGEDDTRIGKMIRDFGYEFPIVFDIGGSNGSWVNVMSKVFPKSRFELFEPLAEINADYKEILVYLKDVHKESYMHPFAIGEKDGTITINEFADPSASTTLPQGLLKNITGRKVPMRTIDSVIAEGLCKSPNLIKIDIQGGELAALKGARKTLPNVTFLMLETWLQRSYGKHTPLLIELIEFLTPLGFLPFEFGDVFRNQKGEAVAVDVWFINKAKANDDTVY